MAKGKIVDWKSDRGFGFARPRHGGPDVFIHIGDLRHVGYEPRIGDEVSFSLKKDPRGRPRAARVVVAGVPISRSGWMGTFKLSIAAVFLLGLFAMTEYRPILFAYLGMSMVAFVAYAIDKSRAKSGGWRTPEATLHWIGFLGGWPGAVLAQMLFRHKTVKSSFQNFFWIIVAIHAGFWTWLQITGIPPGEFFGHVREIANAIVR